MPNSEPAFDESRVAKPEILDACCGGRMWWWDKTHPLATYMDKRVAPPGSCDVRPNWSCEPDVLGDFRAMPFEDESFQLVVFDPPHLTRESESGGYIRLKFGALPRSREQEDLRQGFAECWRVLRPGGTLVFKWADKLERVKPHFPAEPIVGTRSPRGGQTRWFIFYKPQDPDYSPAFQDEYRRLWHEAAAERDKLKRQLERLGWKRYMVEDEVA